MLLEKIKKIFLGQKRPIKNKLKLNRQLPWHTLERTQTPNSYNHSKLMCETKYNNSKISNNSLSKKIDTYYSSKSTKEKFFIDNNFLNNKINKDNHCFNVNDNNEAEDIYTHFNNTGQSHLIIKKIVKINHEIYSAEIFRMPQ